MHFGVSMFHTDYSIPAVQLARALEERGFESMWAPEHSHIPVPRRTPFPGGGEVPKPYTRSWTHSSYSARRQR
jgi:alkanesulfonate monooxygenase SsuD/methylene tetrahydromethanopterin reductase-like flavin-dependent oxidoreductase (luciferase family)